MISARVLLIATLLWPLSEFVLAAATRGKTDRGRVRDRGSLGLMWGAIALGLTAGFALSGLPVARIPLSESWRVGVALALLLGGLTIRIIAGLALSFGSWLSLAVVVVPITASVLYRIRVEESLLEETFGPEYAEYRRATGCLVPRIL